MADPVRIDITNINMRGDYTGVIRVGPQGTPLNVILDTGSSALAIDGNKYHPTLAGGEQATSLAQTDSYGDGSHWTGAVLNTLVQLGEVKGHGVPVAVAYDASADMFQGSDGILGLAYQALDDAFRMPQPTWPQRYSGTEVQQGQRTSIVPCLMQFANEGLLQEKTAFVTRRSFVRSGPDPDHDPLNLGVMILGGGEEATDLYTGTFQVAAVLNDAWYSTNLKSFGVGGTLAPVSSRPATGMPSNSIVDSGTNSLNLGPSLLRRLQAGLSAHQQAQLRAAMQGQPVPVAQLNLGSWPTLRFVLQGMSGGQDVVLDVTADNYWQVDAPAPGQALAAITAGQEGSAILGLPLMAGRFTIFDGTAGLGVVKFAQAR